MAKLFGLTAEQQQRLARVADKVEGQPIQRANQQSGTSKPSPSFWVELTAEDPENPGRYAWKLVDYIDHEWAGRTPAVESPEGEYTAIEANGGSGMTGQKVRVHFYGYDAEGKPRYLFGLTPIQPFLARIVGAGPLIDEGPEREPDHPRNSLCYWAERVIIRQQYSTVGEQDENDPLMRFETIGEPFTVTNIAELRNMDMSHLIRYGATGGRMLQIGQIVGVWAEIDSHGVTRYVCDEYPNALALVNVTGKATGDFEGKYAWYDANEYGPSQPNFTYDSQAIAPTIASILQASLSMSSGVGAPGPGYLGSSLNSLVYHINPGTWITPSGWWETHDNGTQHYATLRYGLHFGYRWGWSNEEIPRRVVIVVGGQLLDPINTANITTWQDALQVVKDSLIQLGLMSPVPVDPF